MDNKRHALGATAAGCALAVAAFAPALAQAAPGTLADAPLFLTNPVEPNIFFLVDDSGSMDWGLMTDQRDGIVNLGCDYYYTQPAADNDYFYIVPTEEALIAQTIAAPYGGVWRAWNPEYNKVYYDPSITYTPWPGTDVNGIAYGNANPAAALVNPYDPAGGTQDLTSRTTFDTDYCSGGLGLFTVTDYLPAHYYTWTDSDNDGVIDEDDAHTKVEIVATRLTYPGGLNRTDCSLKTVCTYAEEIQNFANWYSYYRRREYVAKAAYGQVIAGAGNSRMGLATLHNNASVNTVIDSMNNDPASGAKKTLLDSLYKMQASSNTPLRSALDNSGKYLSCESNGFFGTCPAVTVAQGAECQQNFTIMMTDGYYNGAYSGVGNADGDNDTSWDSGTSGPYGDSSSDTLADIAMEYYEDDIRPTTANKLVPPPGGIDENTEQHMVTYSVAFGVEGGITSMPANGTEPFAWPAPTTNDALIDDLRHSAWNGRGEFYSAQNPTDLITGLRGAVSSIQSRIGSAASVAFNTGSLSTNSEVYLALFNSEQWSGNLLSFDLDPNTGAVATIPNWAAGNRLKNRDLSSKPRTILTSDGTDGIALQWSTMTTAQKNDFRTNASGALDNEVTGIARHAHFRGARGCEFSSAETCYYTDGIETFTSKSLRERDGPLGDIVHSGPVYVGVPESDWPDIAPFPNGSGQTFTEFQEAKANRDGVIYVGGNDGMLHGFDRDTGDEVLGYVPSTLFSTAATDGLHYLSDPGYTHKYYVDLRPTVADAYVKVATSGSAAWHTLLVGGMRGGGRGLFALDVTDPAAFSESGTGPAKTVLWEFDSTDDADLGYTFSRPSIVPMEGPNNTIQWAVILGNGYNDQGSGEAKLFVLLIENGLDGTWSPGDYVEISTKVGDTSDRNGLSTPAVIDSNGDGLADRAYAGDLEGNMWAFDLSGSTPGNWDVAYFDGTDPEPLFIAPNDQQITSSPVIVRNKDVPTNSANVPNTMVIFGTGQYLTAGDLTTTNTQAMYGIWDADASNHDQLDLVEQTIGIGATSGGQLGRTLTDYPVDFTSQFGWFMELPESGERLITDPVIRGDLVFFNTMTPDNNPCEAGGTGFLMVAKWINGGRPDEVAFDISNDSQLDGLDEINNEAAAGIEIVGIPTSPVNLANKRYTSTTQTTGGSTIDVVEILNIQGPRTGRLSWEELSQ